jgi:hypothetical protein
VKLARSSSIRPSCHRFVGTPLREEVGDDLVAAIHTKVELSPPSLAASSVLHRSPLARAPTDYSVLSMTRWMGSLA